MMRFVMKNGAIAVRKRVYRRVVTPGPKMPSKSIAPFFIEYKWLGILEVMVVYDF